MSHEPIQEDKDKKIKELEERVKDLESDEHYENERERRRPHILF